MKTFRAAIVGCGAIFTMHAASLAVIENTSLVAVCDIDEQRAKKRAEEFGCNYYTDYRQMLEIEKPDVLHICTPHYLHAPIAIYALNKGVNVLTEKPMALSVADGQHMIDTAKKNAKALGVIFQNRYNAGSLLIKNTISSGELGAVLGGRASVWWHRNDSYYSNSDWRGTIEKEGGGVTVNQAVHTLDLMCWFIGKQAISVDAFIATRNHPNIEVEDISEGLIRFEGDVLALFQFVNYYSYDAPVEIEIHCEKGTAKLVGDKATITFADGRVVTAQNDPNEVIEYGQMKSCWGVSHVKQIKDYYRCLEAGLPVTVSGEAALPTLRVMCAILESGRKRRVVEI